MVTQGKHAQRVVILGAGIAGSTLALRLAQAGTDVRLIDWPLKLDPLVGESLVPAVTPLLQQLGVEEEVRRDAQLKPGVTFIMRTGQKLEFDLARLGGVTATYAYNSPRPGLDHIIKAKALQAGVPLIERRVPLRAEGDCVVLDPATLEACGLEGQPDLVIDCTGRAQVVRRALGMGGRPGKRRDSCLFAHYINVDLGVDTPGVVVFTVLDAGWCWRIPLPGRMSIGVIADSERWKALGGTSEERLERALDQDPIMSQATARAERITDVKIYNNYQWITDRFVGANWLMVGDSAGFVDPTLSSGVLLALEGALSLAGVLAPESKNRQGALERWEREYRKRLMAWQEFVDYYYEGKLFAMIMQGQLMSKRRGMGLITRHVERHFAGAILGARTMSPYSRRLIRLLAQHGIKDFRPADWAIG